MTKEPPAGRMPTLGSLFTFTGVAAVFFYIQLMLARLLPLDFDSSYNLLLSRTLALTGRYATNMFMLPGREYFPFDGWITTGYPVLAPVAALWALFGVSASSARGVMVVWAFAFLVATCGLLRHIEPSLGLPLRWLLTLLLFYVLGFASFGVYTLGEIPACLLLVGALLLFNAERTPWHGFCVGCLLGLSVMTKTMMLFAAAPAALLYCGALLRERRYRTLCACAVGGVLPIIVQLLWIASQVNLSEWYGWQRAVHATQGMRLHWEHMASSAALLDRLKVFASADPIYFALGVLCSYWLLRRDVFPRYLLLPFVCSFLFFLLLSGEFNSRHTLCSKYVMSLFAAVETLRLIFRSLPAYRATVNGVMVGIAAALLAVVLPQELRDAQNAAEYGVQQRAFAEFVRANLRKSRIFFPGWWKAPEIQLLSDRRFIMYTEENQRLCRRNCYMLVDRMARALTPDLEKEYSAKLGEAKIENNGYLLFEVPGHREQ